MCVLHNKIYYVTKCDTIDFKTYAGTVYKERERFKVFSMTDAELK